MIEFIGYIGSFFIAISLLMSNVYKLRIINLIGAVIFVIYGAFINKGAVWSVNLFIAVVDFYYIIQLKYKRSMFRFIKSKYNDMLKDFINFYIDDISDFFPEFINISKNELDYFIIMRNFVMVGFFAYKKSGEENIIYADYIAPQWRDLKNAINLFLFLSEQEELVNTNFKIKTSNQTHIKYLKEIGFKDKGPDEFVFKIKKF